MTLKRCLCTIFFLVFLFSFFSIPSYAYIESLSPRAESEEDNRNIGAELLQMLYDKTHSEFDGKTTAKTGADYVLTKKLTIRKDMQIGNGSSLHLQGGSVLIIKNGAKLTVNGGLTVEPGASLYITDGEVISNFYFQNYGKVTIRKKGTLTVKGGSYFSNASARLKLEGKADFGGAVLGDVVQQIKAVDRQFDLDSYAVNYYAAKLELCYCIGDALTDYCYTFDPKKSVGLSQSAFPTEKVYDKGTKKKLLAAQEKYVSERMFFEKFTDIRYLKNINIGFRYDFRKGKLTYYEEYFYFSADIVGGDSDSDLFWIDGVSMEQYFTEKVDF